MDCTTVHDHIHRLEPGGDLPEAVAAHCAHCAHCAATWRRVHGLESALRSDAPRVGNAGGLADRVIAALPDQRPEPSVLHVPYTLTAAALAAAAVIAVAWILLRPADTVAPDASTAPVAQSDMPTPSELRAGLALLRPPTGEEVRGVLAAAEEPLREEVDRNPVGGLVVDALGLGARDAR